MKNAKLKMRNSGFSRRRFIRNAGWAFTGLIFVPKLIRAQSILTAPGLASFKKKSSGGGGGGGGDTPFISSVSGGTSRNDFTGIVGFEFTVGGTGITVTSLGRYVTGTSSNAHTVYILLSSGSIVASASVPTSGVSSGTFSWISITPVSLSAATQYACVSKEVNGDGDHWLNDNCTISTTSAATVNFSGFKASDPPTSLSTSTIGVHSFVPPNFKYH